MPSKSLDLLERGGRYFDLMNELRPEGPRSLAETEERRLPVFPQYLSLALGIFVQPFLSEFLKTDAWNWDRWLGWSLAALIIGIMAFPAVYKSSFDRNQPTFVQYCAIFTIGMGWKSLIQGVEGVLGK